MKIVILMRQGSSKELFLRYDSTIKELRNQVAIELNTPWHQIEFNLLNVFNNNLCPIYLDDDESETLLSFWCRMKEFKNNRMELYPDVIYVFPETNKNECINRPIQHQSEVSLTLRIKVKIMNLLSAFFDNTYESRLKKIGFPLDEVPQRYCDPFSGNIMTDPVMTSLQINFDLVTLNQLQDIKVVSHNRQLKTEIGDYILKLEDKFSEGLLVTPLTKDDLLQQCHTQIYRLEASSIGFKPERLKGINTDDEGESLDLEPDYCLDENTSKIAMGSKLSKLEKIKLYFLYGLSRLITERIADQGYAEFYTIFQELKILALYNFDNFSLNIEKVMRTHRSKIFRNSMPGRLVGTLFDPQSAEFVEKFGMFTVPIALQRNYSDEENEMNVLTY